MSERVGTRPVRIVQTVWLVLAVATAGVWAVGPTSQWTAIQTICHPDSACAGFQLDASAARALGQHGISLGAYAAYTLAILALVCLIWYGLAALIIWRKPTDRGAVTAAFFLVVFPLVYVTAFVPSSGPWGVLWFVTIPVFPLFGLLFPDGRFAPGWTRWLAVYCVLASILTALVLIPFLMALFAVVAVQIYRFRAISTREQQQQAKWAFFGLLVGILGLVVVLVLPIFAPAQATNGSLYSAFTVTGIPMVTSAIPISIAIAVLRKRLWDIDRVINRALVYSVLSATLAATYIGCVLGLQALFRVVAHDNSTLAVAVSTLATGALFGPLRRGIQLRIDRRFYRSKYDAARILTAFGDRLRDEVDLAQLSRDLTVVVQETLHPEHVSLWLRDGGQELRRDPERTPTGP